MKIRLSALLLAGCLVLSSLLGCTATEDPMEEMTSTPSATSAPMETPDETEDLPTTMDEATSAPSSDMDDMARDVEEGMDHMIDGVQSTIDDMMSDTATETGDASIDDVSPVLGSPAIDFEQFTGYATTFHGWGQGTIVNDDNIPVSCVDFQEQFGALDAVFVKEEQSTLYLTFDQGYENGYTEAILNTLQEKSCPATFFITMDYATAQPALIGRMLQEGHQIGNHTTTHPSMAKIDPVTQAQEITTLHHYVDNTFGTTMTLFRPPMGEFTEQSLAVTQALGYRTIFWSFAYVDWEVDNQPNPADALEKLTHASHDGAIYLLHTASQTNADILGAFIDAMRAEGYTLGTL